MVTIVWGETGTGKSSVLTGIIEDYEKINGFGKIIFKAENIKYMPKLVEDMKLDDYNDRPCKWQHFTFVFEDCPGWLPDNTKETAGKAINYLLTRHRHFDLLLMFVYHSGQNVPKFLLSYPLTIMMFSADPDLIRAELPGYERLKKTQIEVNNELAELQKIDPGYKFHKKIHQHKI